MSGLFSSALDRFIKSLALTSGAALVVFAHSGAGAKPRTVKDKLLEQPSAFDYMTAAEIADVQSGAYALDVSDALQAYATALNTARLAGPVTSGALTTSYAGTQQEFRLPRGNYKITKPIDLGGYTVVRGENAVIKQFTDTAVTFNWDSYRVSCRGVQIIGGKHAYDIFNANINSTFIEITDGGIFLTRDVAINTRSTHATFTHLSAQLSVYNTPIIACNKILNNCCDSAVIQKCWLQIDKNNLSPNSAVIVNKGVSATDLDAKTRLKLVDTFLIPDVGTYGVDQPANIRWIDNYGALTLDTVRCGGENAGIPVVWQMGGYNATSPWTTTEINIDNCDLFCGPNARPDSCVIGLQGHIPNRISVKRSSTAGRPYVGNISSMNIPAYFTAFEAATGRKAIEYFKFDFDNIISDGVSGGVAQVPYDMFKMMNKGRRVQVRRAAAQSLSTLAFGNNLIAFDTIDAEEVQGIVSLGAPTEYKIPLNATKIRVEVNATLAVTGVAKTIGVVILNSALNRIGGDVELRGVNADSENFDIIDEIEGVPGSTIYVSVKHNGASAFNLTSATIRITPLNSIS